MKYIYTIIFTFTFLTSQGQLDFRLNLDDALKKKFALNIELGSDKFSVELGNRFLLGDWSSVSQKDGSGNITITNPTERIGYIGTIRANFYRNPNTSLDGFHISPTVDYMRQTVKFAEPTLNNRVGMCILFGYKYIIAESKFSVQAETGIGYWFFDKTKVKSTGALPEGEQYLEDLGISSFKNVRNIRAPFNITVNYRIGGD